MKAQVTDASPVKMLLEEMENFRATCRETLHAIGGRLDARVDDIKACIEGLEPVEDITSEQLRDIRDMLTLLCHINVKPDKGRRKDLKKLDAISDDLTMLMERWT